MNRLSNFCRVNVIHRHDFHPGVMEVNFIQIPAAHFDCSHLDRLCLYTCWFVVRHTHGKRYPDQPAAGHQANRRGNHAILALNFNEEFDRIPAQTVKGVRPAIRLELGIAVDGDVRFHLAARADLVREAEQLLVFLAVFVLCVHGRIKIKVSG